MIRQLYTQGDKVYTQGDKLYTQGDKAKIKPCKTTGYKAILCLNSL